MIELFRNLSIQPDRVMILLLFNACAKHIDADSIQLGIRVLNELPATALANRPLTGSAVDMLMKFGQVKKAEDFFARVKTPDVSTYGAMIHGYNHNNQPQSTLSLFDRMKQQRLAPNLALSLALIKATALIGMRPICEAIVKQIPSQHQEDHRSKNALIDMWVSRDLFPSGQTSSRPMDHFKGKALVAEEALKVFRSISQPDVISYTTMSKDCVLNTIELKFLCSSSRCVRENWPRGRSGAALSDHA